MNVHKIDGVPFIGLMSLSLVCANGDVRCDCHDLQSQRKDPCTRYNKGSGESTALMNSKSNAHSYINEPHIRIKW